MRGSFSTDPDIVHWQLENGVNAYLLRTYSGQKRLQLFYSSYRHYLSPQEARHDLTGSPRYY